MRKLQTGEFFGSTYQELRQDNLVITDTEYTHAKVDWHYHKYPYLTYLLQGELFEANKRESYYLKPGSILFHNWQDAHYNLKPEKYTRGMHIEIKPSWFESYGIELSHLEGSNSIRGPQFIKLMNTIFMELKTNDAFSAIGIDMSLNNLFGGLQRISPQKGRPQWVGKLEEILWEDNQDLDLNGLANQLDIHPIHLSREFGRYFGIGLSDYIRMVKVNKAFHLIMDQPALSMTEVCYQCGFYDQSHFILTFKKYYHFTPKKFHKKINDVNSLQF